jgi:hypothetical protein
MEYPVWYFSTFLLLLSLSSLSVTFGRNIQIDVKSSWPRYSSSFVAELSEFLYEQSPQSFWKYVDELCAASDKLDASISGAQQSADAFSDLHSTAFDAASKIAAKSMHNLMDTMLGLGAYAPAVRFFSSLSEPFGNPCQGNAFMVIYPGEQIQCDFNRESITKAAEIASLMAEEQTGATSTTTTPTPLSDEDIVNRRLDIADLDSGSKAWDHYYLPDSTSTATADASSNSASSASSSTSTSASSSGPGSVKVVLYGVVGSTSFCALHRTLSTEASQPASQLRYTMRHAFPGQTPLSKDSRLQVMNYVIKLSS